ncbi:MAG: putative HNH endonuclease [Caudoviricetes sp.]|nr:MAG: putative HNH endonuclease [Caudoviricetes sp.]
MYSVQDITSQINEAFAQYAVPIAGTDCTEWTGPTTGSGVPEVFLKGENADGENLYARTVGQCVHFLQTEEDLNNSDLRMFRTCSSVGCTNPNHYVLKQINLKNDKVKVPKKSTKKSSKLYVIPRYLLREEAFNVIKQTYKSNDNVLLLSKSYNIPTALVRKIMDGKAVRGD